MIERIEHIPTNVIMGFLGVGKTTAILHLLKQKPKNENWAILVNEFGKVGIDGAIFAAAGATVKEIAGGCLCCALALPFQVSINRLIKEVRPDRLLIEPTGLGHPQKVLQLLSSGSFKDVLDVRASICLVDPQNLKNSRYTNHENFVDQIALSDVLVANKMDLADAEASQLFHQWAMQSKPDKALVGQTQQGHLELAWLDLSRNQQRRAVYPEAHQIRKMYPVDSQQTLSTHEADGYQSFGYLFSAQNCFDYLLLNEFFKQLKLERIKGIFNSNKGWFIINSVAGQSSITPSSPSENSRIEIIIRQNQAYDFSKALNRCLLVSDGSL